MPISIKVNGKELTLAQIAAILAIVGVLGGAGVATYNHFAKSSQITTLIKSDWSIQTSLLDIKINTNKIILKQTLAKKPTIDSEIVTWQLYIDSVKEKIANDNAEKAAICAAQIKAAKELEVVPCASQKPIKGLNQIE